MKKVIFCLGCSMLMGTFCMAQETTITPAPSPDSAPSAVVAPQVVEATTQTPTPEAVPAATSVVTQEAVETVPGQTVVEAPVAGTEVIVNDGTLVQGAPIEGAPMYMEGQVVDSGQFLGQVVEGQTYPELSAPVAYESLGQSVMSAPMVDQNFATAPAAPVDFGSTPVDFGTSIMTAPVATESVVADPFAAPVETAGSECVNCPPTSGRRQILRSVTTRGRSVFTRIRNVNRIRGLFGRLR